MVEIGQHETVRKYKHQNHQSASALQRMISLRSKVQTPLRNTQHPEETP